MALLKFENKILKFGNTMLRVDVGPVPPGPEPAPPENALSLNGEAILLGNDYITVGQGVEPQGVQIGGRFYPTVTIGNQEWLAENLDFKFSGLVVGQGSSSSEPRANYYDNDEATYGVNGNKYGLLYNWIAVKYLEDHKSTLLPDGWHVPTATEWDTLATDVGGSDVAGTKLKSTTGWYSGNGDGSYGFEAFPAGIQNSGFFDNLSIFAYFWTATEDSSSNAYYSYFDTDESMYSNDSDKSPGLSVRLVRTIS